MSEFDELHTYQEQIRKFNEKSKNDRAKLQLRCTPYTDKKFGYGCHDLDFGLSIWNHQQEKIDAVLKLIESSEKYSDRSIHGLQDEIKELLK